MPHVELLEVSDLPSQERVPGRSSHAGGRAQLAAVDRALDLVLAGKADAMVTGPVSKKAITDAGVPFTGHTEHLQARTSTPRVVPRIRTAI